MISKASKQEVIQDLKEKIEFDPTILGDLFKLVSDHWKKMVETQRRERESAHLHILYDVVNFVYFSRISNRAKPKLLNSYECCSLSGVINVCYPDGPETKGMSEAMKKVLQLFIDSCQTLNLDWQNGRYDPSDVKT